MLAREREGDGFVTQDLSEGSSSESSFNRVHGPLRRMRRLAPAMLYLVFFLVLTMESGPSAVEVPPAASPFFLRTHGAAVSLNIGDWYSNSGQGNGYHYVTITISCDWPSGTPVHVDLFSPSINSGIPGGLDDESGTADSTQFELYASGTTVGPPPAWGTPGPLAAGSLTQTTYLPEGGDAWVRFATITPGACTGVREPWVVRSAVLAPGDDENGWRIRVGRDDDVDPTNAPPANYDNFDGVAGTNDELLVGVVQALYMQTSGGTPDFDLFEYVPPGQLSTTVHNFDYGDGSSDIDYFAPSGGLPIAGTEGANGEWNGGDESTRGGQTLATTESGWWRTNSALGNNNQVIQEGQTGVAHYLAQPPTPAITASKTNGVTQVSPGQVVTYTVTASNSSGGSSPGAANNVVLTDTLPPETTFQSCDFVAPASGSCTHSGGVVTATMTGALDAGSSADLTVTVRVNDLTSGTATNTVSADYEDSLGNAFPAATASDADPIVNTKPDAVDDSATTFQGSPVTVTVLANDTDAESNIDASSVTVTADPANGSATVNPDGTITYAPNPSFTGIDTFTYQVCDFGGLCAIAFVTITVEPSADLSITKLDDPNPVLAGNNVTYTVTVTNNGPSDATSFTVTDTVAAGVDIVSVSPACTSSGSVAAGWQVTCTNSSSFAPTDPPISFTIVARVESSMPDDAQLLNNAFVTAASPVDPDTSNNSASTVTDVDTEADLSIVKSDAPDPVIAGTNLTYTLTVDNAGPSDALNVVVSDPLPAGTTFVSATGGGTYFPATNTVVWNVGTFTEARAPLALSFTVNVNSSQTADLSNTASVTSTTTDPNPANNSDTEVTVVNESAALSIVKVDSPDPVVAGTNVTYTVTVTNAGPSDATSVAVSDPIPAGTSFVSASAGGSLVTGTVTWDLGTVPAGETRILTLVVRVDPGRTTPISNTATVSSVTPDPNPANNSDSESTSVITSADLSIVKVDDPDPVSVEGTVTYTVTVTNLGPSDALNVTMEDTLPAGLTFTSISPATGCTETSGTLTCDVGTLAAGASTSWTIVASVGKVGGPIFDQAGLINHAETSSTTPDPVLTNNQVDQETTVSAPNVTLVKSADPSSGSELSPGDPITYTITYTNLGSVAATSFVVSDTVSEFFGDVVPSPPGTFDPVTRVITWNIGVIEAAGGPADSGSVTFTARVGSTTSRREIRNMAIGTADEYAGPIESNETRHDLVPPDVLITKRAGQAENSEVRALEVVTYQLAIRNRGSGRASGVVVTDDPPPFMNYVPGSTQLDGVTVPDSGGTSVLFGSGVVMDINRNSTRVVSFRMQVDVAAPPGTLLQNWGFASWNLGREVSADFFDLRVTTPRSGPRLRQSVMVVGPSGETFFVTIFNEIIGILPFTGYQTFVILILGLAAFGFGGSLSSRIVPDLLRRRNDE